jgi:hypothetical protein
MRANLFATQNDLFLWSSKKSNILNLRAEAGHRNAAPTGLELLIEMDSTVMLSAVEA